MFVDHVMRLQTSANTGKKGSVTAVSFDIQKAFDTVPFDKLINCLRHEYYIPECLLAWLCSYFYDRKQSVKVNRNISTWRPVRAGVVQGSIIGPLLFIAYFDKVINDKVNAATAIKYADDLILIHPTNSPDDEIAAAHN
jgi:hypothetical protein